MAISVSATAVGILLAMALAGSPARGEPFVPATDNIVLERLPRGLGGARAIDRPVDLPGALALARRYFEQGQRSQDPRLVGYARAALAPWWEDPVAPPTVLVMRAAILQNRHDFDGALADRDRALALDPGNAEGWAARATIELVRGEPERSLASCARLDRVGASIAGTICRAAAMARLGQAAAAFVLLDLTLQRSRGLSPALELWGRNELAEIARILGDPDSAERELRKGLAVSPSDAFTLCALADLLLDLDRPAEALALVEDEPGHDGKLLRGALAARRLDAPWWREQARILGERFAAATQRGDALHLREEARYRLALADDAAGALRLATANWRAQREFWDAKLVLESALAAGESRAAAEVTAWLAATGLDDARLRPFLQRLGAQGWSGPWPSGSRFCSGSPSPPPPTRPATAISSWSSTARGSRGNGTSRCATSSRRWAWTRMATVRSPGVS
jgi:tetratricopeptide (TPR) repeat protein